MIVRILYNLPARTDLTHSTLNRTIWCRFALDVHGIRVQSRGRRIFGNTKFRLQIQYLALQIINTRE